MVQEYLQLYRKLQSATGHKRPAKQPRDTQPAATPMSRPSSTSYISSDIPQATLTHSASDSHSASASNRVAQSETQAELLRIAEHTANDGADDQADFPLQARDISNSVDTGSLDNVEELKTALALSRQQPADKSTSSTGEQPRLRNYGDRRASILGADFHDSSSDQDSVDSGREAAALGASDESTGTLDSSDQDMAETSGAESPSDDESEAAASGSSEALEVEAMQKRAAQLRMQMG